MDILSKITQVEVTAQEKVSAADQKALEAYQRIYDNALSFYDGLMNLWTTAKGTEAEIRLSLDGKRPSEYYMASKYKASDAEEHKKECHKQFVKDIVSYFNHMYKVQLSAECISTLALPVKPERRRGIWGAHEKYQQEMRELHLDWKHVVEKICLELGGSVFAEIAVGKLKANCLKEAFYEGDPRYSIRGKSISLPYGVDYNNVKTYHRKYFIPNTRLKTFLSGLHHFFCEELRNIDDMNFQTTEKEYELPYDQIEKLKFYMSLRADIVFKDAATAYEFARQYLGYIDSAAA